MTVSPWQQHQLVIGAISRSAEDTLAWRKLYYMARLFMIIAIANSWSFLRHFYWLCGRSLSKGLKDQCPSTIVVFFIFFVLFWLLDSIFCSKERLKISRYLHSGRNFIVFTVWYKAWLTDVIKISAALYRQLDTESNLWEPLYSYFQILAIPFFTMFSISLRVRFQFLKNCFFSHILILK